MIRAAPMPSPGFAYALAAALLFGASTPFAKIFLRDINVWSLAGILYLGAGVGLLILFLIRPFIGFKTNSPSPLRRGDWTWLASSTVFGGILAPLLLMNGLARTEASAASLLLNLETVFTVALAWFVFMEPFYRRVLWGMILILSGAVLLSWPDHVVVIRFWGPALVVASCLCWAIDNNVTRKIAEKDPLQIAMMKSLAAGATNVSLAVVWHVPFPKAPVLWAAGTMGFFCYGVSLCCFILSLRHLGTSRTSAVFSLAPFVGAGLSALVLAEPFSARLWGAGLLMGLGLWLYLTEKRKFKDANCL